MGQMSQFGELVHPVMDYVVRGPIIRFFANLGRVGRWKNLRKNVLSNFFLIKYFFMNNLGFPRKE
jgi:hypothetical protein